MANCKHHSSVFRVVVPSLYKPVRVLLDYIGFDDSGSWISGPDFYHISRLLPPLFL